VPDELWELLHRVVPEAPTRRQGLRPRPPGPMVTRPGHHASHRSQGRRVQPTPGTRRWPSNAPWPRSADVGVCTPSLRAQSQPLLALTSIACTLICYRRLATTAVSCDSPRAPGRPRLGPGRRPGPRRW